MKCRVCDNEKLEMFLDLGDQPHCDNFLPNLDKKEPYYPLQVCFCHKCTTVQINHTVPKEIMFDHFLYLSGTTQTLKKHFKETTERLVKNLNLKSNDLVVDIGSNDGTWLGYYKKHGMRTLGIEPALDIADYACRQGIDTWARYFNLETAKEILDNKGKAKLITAAGVFFHLEELHSVTSGVRELLAKDGVFCIQAIYLGSILQNTQFDQIYHEHLTYWTVKSLKRLLELHGLEINSVDLLPIHGGSLEVIVSHRGSRPVENSVRNYIFEEECANYDKIETYHDFTKKVWLIKDKLLSIINDYKSKGKSIQAFGAPAKGSTLLNSFGITKKQIDCAIEVNPLKIDRYIPGCRIKINDEKVTEKPDVYLLLAWNFLGEFLKNKSDYILNGGEFIVSVPKPFIINKSNWEQFIK